MSGAGGAGVSGGSFRWHCIALSILPVGLLCVSVNHSVLWLWPFKCKPRDAVIWPKGYRLEAVRSGLAHAFWPVCGLWTFQCRGMNPHSGRIKTHPQPPCQLALSSTSGRGACSQPGSKCSEAKGSSLGLHSQEGSARHVLQSSDLQ